MYSQNKNVTYLDDLPDLEDLEQSNRYQQDPGIYKKFIRNTQTHMAPESGMATYSPPPNHQHQPQPQEFFDRSKPSDNPTCLDVHGHIIQCPICSRFFKFDNTIYIISIIVLSIICILLLKRVLNV